LWNIQIRQYYLEIPNTSALYFRNINTWLCKLLLFTTVSLQFLILQWHCIFLFTLLRPANGPLKDLTESNINYTIILLQRIHFDWLTCSFLSVVMGRFPLNQRKPEFFIEWKALIVLDLIFFFFCDLMCLNWSEGVLVENYKK